MMELIVMAAILAAVLIVQYMVYKNIGLNDIDYTLTISKNEAFEGDEIEITETIANNKWLPLPWARSEISCSRWLAFYGGAQNVAKDAQKGLVSGIFMLRGHQKLRRVWKVRCEKRGVFAIEDVTISVSDLFGLCKPSNMIKLSEQITVLPSPCDMPMSELSDEHFIGDNTVRRFILPDPFIISGAKEYTGREPMNRIHWAQTAKTGSLMVYNNEFSTERKLLIVLNLQRKALDEKVELTVSVMEAQIKAAAFVLDQCYRSHIAVALAVNSEDRFVSECREDYEHIVDMLRVLARLKKRCGQHIDSFMQSLAYQDYTDVLLISNILTDESAEVLQRLIAEGRYAALLSNEISETDFCDVVHVPRTRSYPEESGDGS